MQDSRKCDGSGRKLFEECGKVTAISVRSVHSVEGIKMEVSFASEMAGIDKFPSGRNMGSGTMTRYPHDTIDASYHSVFETKEGGQFSWWAHDKSRVAEGGGKTRGITIVSGFSNSQKLSWLNSLVMVIESEFDPESQGYQALPAGGNSDALFARAAGPPAQA